MLHVYHAMNTGGAKEYPTGCFSHRLSGDIYPQPTINVLPSVAIWGGYAFVYWNSKLVVRGGSFSSFVSRVHVNLSMQNLWCTSYLGHNVEQGEGVLA